MTHAFLDNLEHLRRTAESREEAMLSPLAALSKDHSRREGAELDHRLAYKRDVDRIVHSRAYARYIDKTQVLYLVDNDHITHRVLHVQLVSNFARGIAEILGLNCDLVEAIALGHDVGHPPFGHEGEGYLSQLSVEAGEGPFAHPAQSCRLLSVIEPLNLGLAVYDGFLCHDGGLRELKYEPKLGKSWEDHDRELAEKWSDPDGNIWPGTMEGCLVKLCDTASYLGRDIEDAIRVGILKRDEVPETVLGVSNREILSRVARDIIAQSEDHISISAEVMEALKVLRQFNFERIYMEPSIKVESSKIERSYRILFETLLNDFEKRGDGSLLWRKFLHNKGEAYRSGSSGARLVIDYISGMTDNYFVRAVEEVVVPRRIALK